MYVRNLANAVCSFSDSSVRSKTASNMNEKEHIPSRNVLPNEWVSNRRKSLQQPSPPGLWRTVAAKTRHQRPHPCRRGGEENDCWGPHRLKIQTRCPPTSFYCLKLSKKYKECLNCRQYSLRRYFEWYPNASAVWREWTDTKTHRAHTLKV